MFRKSENINLIQRPFGLKMGSIIDYRLSSTRSLYIDPTAGIIFDIRFGNRKQSKFYYLPLYGIYDNKFHRNSILPLRNLVTFILFDVENFDKHFISEQSYNTFEKLNYLNIE